MSTLVVAQFDHIQQTACAISAAAQFSETCDVLLFGQSADEVAALKGVHQVLLADHLCYAAHLAENSAKLIAHLGKSYDVILAPANTFGKDVIPRAASCMGVGMVSDVIEIIDHETFVRPIYAGNALATVKSTAPIKILTVRATAFDCAKQSASSAPIQSVDHLIENTQTTLLENKLSESTRPELTAARVIVSGGRGLQSASQFEMLERLADKLGAAIGATRAAVDAGFVPNDYQVGQTGKIVAPELYIAIGISGAVQHLAGMKDSKVIVAINKDEDAPIFSIADYGLVGDLFDIVPEFIEALD